MTKTQALVIGLSMNWFVVYVTLYFSRVEVKERFPFPPTAPKHHWHRDAADLMSRRLQVAQVEETRVLHDRHAQFFADYQYLLPKYQVVEYLGQLEYLSFGN